MSHKIIVTAFCRNRYDHSDFIQHDMCTDYIGSATDPDNSGVYGNYITWAKSRAGMKETGWVSVIEVDMITGLSTILFTQTNPLLERVELNKEAKIKKNKNPFVAMDESHDFSSTGLSDLIASMTNTITEQT